MSINKYEILSPEKKYVDHKIRVAMYCRVSTDSQDQVNSFENQKRYFKQYIEHKPNWELFEIFTDMKISNLIQIINGLE